MGKVNPNWKARHHRRKRIRKKLTGTSERPRLAVFKSNHHLYAQLIDDRKGHTVAAVSTLQKDLKGTPDTSDGGKKVGQALAERAKAAGVEQVVFDRGGFRYHGVVKSIAEAVREGGLKF